MAGGYGNDQNWWLVNTDLMRFTRDKPVIIVLLDGDPSGLHIDYADGSYYWETFMVSRLIPYIDRAYRTTPLRRFRAVAGLSAGGFGALHVAARHPDDFVAAGGFSGFLYDITRGSPASEVALSAFALTPPPLPDLNDPFPFLGDPVMNDVQWHNHNPAELATNLRGMSLYMAVGDQVPCNTDDVGVLVSQFPAAELEAVSFEQLQDFDKVLTSASIAHSSDFYGCGVHSAPYWQRDLHLWWPMMMRAFGSPAPKRFDYRTADPHFSIWGWTFSADPIRAPEFIDASNVSCRGLTLTGSGTTAVKTGSCFTPGTLVRVAGAMERTVRVERDGRIVFRVDLGPAHQTQQYTAQERILETAGMYFRSVTVSLENL
jgi:S-formylglutathione hydrolase FrmB